MADSIAACDDLPGSVRAEWLRMLRGLELDELADTIAACDELPGSTRAEWLRILRELEADPAVQAEAMLAAQLARTGTTASRRKSRRRA